MSLQLTKRTQRNISCAILAVPFALANLSGVHAQTVIGTPAVIKSTTTTVSGTTTVYAATVKTAAQVPTTGGKTDATNTTNSTTTVISPTIKTTTPAPAQSNLAYNNTSAYGNFLRPFAATSLWNSRPVNPVFGTFVIPTSSYYPAIGPSAFSTGAFEAKATDPEMVIYPSNAKGVWDPDAEAWKPSITIPRWPSDVVPAAGGDGHADIVDPVTGIVHSFWQLKKAADGKWTAYTYAWTKIDGSGWGDPAHYYQGARAAAVPPMGGLIRKHEVNDGKATYTHALAMSLTFNGLGAKPAYVFPATSADTNAATLNSGGIPEGALVMLPPSFDLNTITDPKLKKIAATLKLYGAYVVDQNVGTPFYIYVENGADFDLHKGKWNTVAANELHKIRLGLRMVTSSDHYLDGTNKRVAPEAGPNLLSMRGTYTRTRGTATATFDSWAQALQITGSPDASVFSNGNGRGITNVTWARPVAGDTLKLTAKTTGGGKLRIQVWSGSKLSFDTGALNNGESSRFVLPAGYWYVVLVANAGGNVPATISGTLEKVAP